jgi:pilus assembly protein TadC
MSERLSNIYLPNKFRHKLQKNLDKIQSKSKLEHVFRKISFLSVLVSAAAILCLNFLTPTLDYFLVLNRAVISASLFVFCFAFFYLASWLLFSVYVDLKIYSRMRAIEEHLPAYLEFAAANLRAGMPIDKALWLAIRPRFGPLAFEMEKVAKDTMSGEEISIALTKFSNKYDSPTLKRTVSLLNEGLEAGGKMSDLITKISWDLEEIGIIRKEIYASVLNYIMFIGFATIIAAPILFSLCSMLLNIVSNLGSLLPTGASPGMQSMPTGLFKSGISQFDFSIYAYLSLSVTAVFSAMIISIIQKGRIRDGLKYIPFFVIATVVIFTAAKAILESLFSGIM